MVGRRRPKSDTMTTMTTGELRLRPLRLDDEAAALVAHEAMAEEQFSFLLHYDDGMSWHEYVQLLDGFRDHGSLPTGLVPGTFLLAIVGTDLVGRASIRYELNEYLAVAGGHIGYGVVREHRGKGYATTILRQSLVIARSQGVGRALLTCDIDNLTSARVIERCGGIFESTVDDPRGGSPKRRYWID
jgi:predicted acetyltransferase